MDIFGHHNRISLQLIFWCVLWFLYQNLNLGGQYCRGLNNNNLFDCRHTAQSNTTNIHHAGQDTQQPPRRAALYTEGLRSKWQATNDA